MTQNCILITNKCVCFMYIEFEHSVISNNSKIMYYLVLTITVLRLAADLQCGSNPQPLRHGSSLLGTISSMHGNGIWLL